MANLFWAQASAVVIVAFGGLSVYQLTASHAEMEMKALRFAELAAEDAQASLRGVRIFAYGLLPLAYLALLALAGFPVLALLATALKVALSASLSLWIENRLLAGEGYSPARHRLTRLDSFANLALCLALVYALLYLRAV